MCGIAGCWHPDGLPEAAVAGLEEAGRRLSHRGPDGSGRWSDPAGRCAFAHTRLAVIDLQTGDQPMSTPDGRVTAVYNGEIYNFRELRDELGAVEGGWRTESDTEVLLHGFRAWGPGMVERLNGMFALALWDREAGRLLLARDRAGQKPLYLYRRDRFLAFASEIDALRSVPGVEAPLRSGALPEYLSYGYVPGAGTFHEGVEKLAPGSLLVADSGTGETNTSRYWRLDVRPDRISDEEAVSGVREHTREAVRRRLISDVPLGAFLSGGVDSTVVVGLMSELSDAPVSTYSIGFEDQPDFDETAWAERVAERFGTEHTTFTVGPGAIDLVDRLVEAYDEPFGDSSALPTFMVSELARREVTVALTGDGGDEVFAGYARMRGAQLADRIPRPVASVGKALASLIPHHEDFRSRPRRIARFLAAADLPEAARALHWMPYFGERLGEILKPDVLAEVDPASLRRSLQEPIGRHAGRSALARVVAMNFESYLPEDLLVKADRSSMAHGLELRAPFLDPELVAYAAGLPDDCKIRGRSQKWVLKEAFSDLLPPEVSERPKWGFGVPLPQWFRTHWRPLLEERLLPADARIHEWVRRGVVERMVREHAAGTTDESHRLWALLTLETWLRR